MTITPTALEGVYLIEVDPIEDERGFFARAWCSDTLARRGLQTGFVQANISYSKLAGTVRGLHYQAEPHAEAKVVRCVSGAIYDVAVDARPGSPTFGRWVRAELTASNRRSLYVPEGFAHGYQTLQADSEVHYMVSQPYAAHAERGLRYDDPALGITWPLEATAVSAKDRAWPLL
jgi:dTDP-4-dehydrorhamnose 3,5-epimerase